MSRKSDLQATLALLRRLAVRDAVLNRDSSGVFVIGNASTAATGKCDQRAAKEALRRGLVSRSGSDQDQFVLGDAGAALVRRYLSGAEDFQDQHGARQAAQLVQEDGRTVRAMVNRDESPLAWLQYRKVRDGQPMVGAAEFAAGERLRRDFTRGQLMPRVTANWSAVVASERRGGGITELSEAAMGARLRVTRALDAVGPELAGLLVDVCCFLKGLEEVERERRWPARSAKIVLRVGLAALARHYGLASVAQGRQSAVRHWGSEDYRPAMD